MQQRLRQRTLTEPDIVDISEAKHIRVCDVASLKVGDSEDGDTEESAAAKAKGMGLRTIVPSFRNLGKDGNNVNFVIVFHDPAE